MESGQQASPNMQYDHSPTESFISTPREAFSPLFTAATPSAVPGTMNPMDMLSPGYDDEDVPTKFEDNEEDTAESGMPSTSDKKPTKKRKSWGQVLPEPKTNLPPRKRAKTEDEKEQRRVERVLRNRRAAQSSRERKRKEVEALEDRNRVLEKALAKSEKLRELMAQQLAVYQRKEGSLPKSVTLSQELFSSQDSLKNEPDTSGLSFLDNIPSSSQAPNPTVNPASLSPELAPVSDVELAKVQETAPEAEAKPSKETSPASSDLTQHPAAVLCDLQCQSEVVPEAFLDSQKSTLPLWALLHSMMMFSASAILSACHRPLMQIALSTRANFSLRPTRHLLATIIWTVTTPRASQKTSPSISATSSPTMETARRTSWQRATRPLRSTVSTSPSSTLRLKSLRKILSSSPNLARPLMDATMEALRLVSEGRDYRVEMMGEVEAGAPRGAVDREPSYLNSTNLPSKEALITLLWVLRSEERKIARGKKFLHRGTLQMANDQAICEKMCDRDELTQESSRSCG
jgi:transcriptional activator HAC1